MKQLLILSGKGGTGKTTIASAFIKLADAKAYSDCDVDAPNLHLVMTQLTKSENCDFYGMPTAKIDEDLCNNCNLCSQFCRFDAIISGDKTTINQYACEGCGLCVAICPNNAISMVPKVSGELQLYPQEHVFSTAKLKIGSGNSGLLVTQVKKQMKENSHDVDIAIIDGSPGIGCPVIASLSNVDMALIVAEPTVSGISDLTRIIKTALQLQVDIMVCINKYDINIENTKKIETICREFDLPVPNKIPFDLAVPSIINSGKTIVEKDCIAGKYVEKVFDHVIRKLVI